jgi:hypothetical protein
MKLSTTEDAEARTCLFRIFNLLSSVSSVSSVVARLRG